MGVEPRILFGKVMHGRLFPKRNSFTYNIYYLALSLSNLKTLPIAYNRFAHLSFYDRDHGHCDGSSLQEWARGILNNYGIQEADGNIMLICMPRILGYVFNPVSFWLCYDKRQNLRAVLCEVHNTFKERHTYLCIHEDHRIITESDILTGRKVFHVSPFLKREGRYEFRFDVRNSSFSAWINFYNEEDKKQLSTSLIGTLNPMNKRNLRKAFWGYPLVTFKVILLIHWQAFKLVFKKIKYISKPDQNQECISITDNLTKM